MFGLICLILLMELTLSFRFGNRPELIYDTGRLPNGREVNTYVIGNRTERFYFMNGDKSSLFIKVTPCASTIDVNISWSSLTNKDNVSSLIVHRQRGQRPVIYSPSDSDRGVTGIAVWSNETTSIKIYASTRTWMYPYPLLPENKQVKVVKVKKRSFSLKWEAVRKIDYSRNGVQKDKRNRRKKIQENNEFSDSDIEYCISVTTEVQVFTDCQAKANILGYYGPQLPIHSGFGFKHIEKERKRKIKALQRSKIKVDSKQAQYKCTNATSIRFSQLQSDTTYYVLVSAINRLTNSSSEYEPSKVVTKSNRHVKLKSDRLYELSFRKRVERSFLLKSDERATMLYAAPCGGPFHFQFGDTDKVHHRLSVDEKQLINLTQFQNNQMLTIRGNGRNHSVAIALVSKNHSDMVVDPKFRINNVTCNSVTLGWQFSKSNSRSEDALICLFAKKTSATRFCSQRPRREDKVGCWSVHDDMSTVILGIDHIEDYLFELVYKQKGLEFKYKLGLEGTKSCDI